MNLWDFHICIQIGKTVIPPQMSNELTNVDIQKQSDERGWEYQEHTFSPDLVYQNTDMHATFHKTHFQIGSLDCKSNDIFECQKTLKEIF